MIIKLSYGFIFNYFYTIFTYFTQLTLLNLIFTYLNYFYSINSFKLKY